jgi:TonB family protein
MNEFLIEKLNEHVDGLLEGREPEQQGDLALRELMQVAEEVALLPSPGFQVRLQKELSCFVERWASRREPGEGSSVSEASASKPRERDEAASLMDATKSRSFIPSNRNIVVPPTFASGSLTFPMSGSRLALSFGLHVLALALIGTSGWWVVENRQVVRMKVAELVPVTDDYVLPVAPGKIGGGGGGGDRDKMDASHGTAPRFTAQQLTPPLAVVRNQNPALPAELTLVGPPDIVMPQSDKLGDPMANILNPPSNGTGSGGGIGSGEGGGIGSGKGPGIGEGYGGGIGGGVFRVGGGVSAPRPLYDPDPEYSDEARKAKFQGTVMLSAIIGPDGRPRDLRVLRSVGMGLDQKALDAVGKWRFAPGTKDNHPVSVLVSIEVAFRLY